MKSAMALAGMLVLLAAASSQAASDARPVVIGQSPPLTGPAYPIANRIQAGTRALLERLNIAGGIAGRPLEVVTLDDAGDRGRQAANLRRLVTEHGAVAIANCVGEGACLQAAATTAELGVPLVGTFSGAASLRTAAAPHVFALRADDRQEAEALARQLRSMGVARAAWLADGEEPAREQALAVAMQAAQVQLTRIAATPDQVEAALRGAGKTTPQAVLLSVGPATADALARVQAPALEGWPSVVATLSSASLTQLTRLFRDRTVGFTSVVPNPEISQLPLVREFERDADAHGGAEAVSFEGLGAYIHLRVLAAALRAAGPPADARRLKTALQQLGPLDLGGLRLQLSAQQRQGLDLVEIGLRARDGRLRR